MADRTLQIPKPWLIAFLLCAAVVFLSFAYVDVPIARRFYEHAGQLGPGLNSAIILSLEAATVLALVGYRLARGRLSRLGETLGLATIASLCSYAVNDGVLKLLLGVPNPQSVLSNGSQHAFHFLGGSNSSSFPSGHMVLASAFAGVFMRLYPSSRLPFSALLLFGAALLVFGDWHFASDVISGAFVGVSAGILAGALWQVHSLDVRT